MAVGEQFRLAEIYDTFFLDYKTPVRLRVDLLKDDLPVPYDLTQFDSVELVLSQDLDGGALIVPVIPLLVLTGAEDLVDGIACRAEGEVLISGVQLGTYRAKMQGVVGGTPTLIEKPWQFGLFDGGPSS